jgi:predicted nucleic acid-binding protein
MTKKELKIYLDSNVIVSGLVSEKGPSRVILDLLSLDLPFLHGVTGRYSFMRIERGLKRILPGMIPLWRRDRKLLGLKAVPKPSFRDVKRVQGKIARMNAPVIASAERAQVHYLVTEDKREMKKAKLKYTFKIISPSEFVNTVFPKALRRLL